VTHSKDQDTVQSQDTIKASRRDFIQKGAALSTGLVAAVAGTVSATASAAAPAQAARPLSATEKFRALLQRPGLTVAPEAYSVFTARMAELNGFEAVYVGGNMISAMHLGFDDYGIVSITELIEVGGRIAGKIDIPVILDSDQLGETALTVYRHMKEYQKAGVAALHVEDTRNPKHQGAGVSDLMPIEEMALRLQAAKEAKSDPNFTIIARSDAMSLAEPRGNLDELIRRGKAYAAAGADMFFPTGITVEQIDQLAAQVPIPLLGLNIPAGPARSTKMKVIILNQVWQPTVKVYEDMLLGLKKDGVWPKLPRLPQETVDKVMHTAKYQELTNRWNSTVRKA